jgi:hypothetical protein
MKRGFLKAAFQMMVMFALMYSCTYLLIQAIEADTRDELLTREQKAEIMHRQSDFDKIQQVEMASEILNAKAAKAWEERCLNTRVR